MTPVTASVFVFIVIGLFMVYLWLRQKSTKNAGTVDVAWASSFGFVALFYACALGVEGQRQWFVAALVCIWSFRLGSYLFKRVANMPEDSRYAGLRDDWGPGFEKKLFFFFQFQALTVVFLSTAFMVPMFNATPLFQWYDFLAAGVLAFAVIGESIADRQLAAFKADKSNKGKVCDSGLWKYSRHPNYFFEWFHWWTYPLLSLNSEYFFIPFIVAIAMLFFILKMTGIPATEEHMVRSRGQAYIDYQNKTSSFIPWFNKKNS